MTSEQELVSSIYSKGRPEDIVPLLEQLNSYPEEVRWTVLATGMRALKELEYPHLQDFGIDLCLTLRGPARNWLEDFLTDWLDDLPVAMREKVRDEWLTTLIHELQQGNDAERKRAALWMALAIGYRADSLVQCLEQVAGLETASDAPPELQDIALWVLTWIGYPDDGALIEHLHTRLSYRETPTLWLFSAVRLLGSRELFAPVVALYEKSVDDADLTNMALRALAEIAYENPDIADAIWWVIEMPANQLVAPSLKLASDISPRIDSPSAVDYFVRQMHPSTVRSDLRQGVISPHYYAYTRLRQLSLPQQLAGFRNSTLRHSADVTAAIRLDACKDTEYAYRLRSVNTHIKTMSWDIGLRLGLDGITSWFPDALDETSTYTKAEICDLAGYVRADAAIHRLREAISQPDTDLILAVAAMRALGNIGTFPALDALLHNAIVIKDSVPQQFVDALFNAALSLRDSTPLVDYLDSDSGYPLTRMACAAALEQITAAYPDLVLPHRTRLLAMLHHGDRLPGHTAPYLMAALGFLPRDEADAAFLREVAVQGGLDAWRACEALARWKDLVTQPDLLTSLGLRDMRGAWTIERLLDYREAFILGILYCTIPVMFEPAVVETLERAGYFEASQVLWPLQSQEAVKMTPDVEEALVNRIKAKNSHRQAETEAMEALAALSPKRFARELTYPTCADWYVPARETVVGCLRSISEPDVSRGHAVDTLGRFITDPAPSVRRAAARALSELNNGSLVERVTKLIRSEQRQDREYGAEAASWIQEDLRFEDANTQGRHDREESVRKVARLVRNERRERGWASEYWNRVILTSNDAVLEVWHYGQALRDVGDDDNVRLLKDASSDSQYGANKRAWFEWLAEGVEKKWEDRQSKRNER